MTCDDTARERGEFVGQCADESGSGQFKAALPRNLLFN